MMATSSRQTITALARGLVRALPFLLLIISSAARALDPVDPLAQRMNALTRELRCLVCQNQTLADSDAELAIDLRQEIREMMQAGKTDEEIVDFLVNRYGDFVRYRPPVDARTAVLWIGPALMAVAGLWSLIATLRRRQPLLGDAATAAVGNEPTNSFEGTG